MADADARRRAEEALAEIAAGDHGEYCGLRNGMLLSGGKTECYSDCPKRVAKEALEALLAAGPEARAPGHDRIAELESLLRECNAVCLCGCPDAKHEADECGEGCGHDGHECIRVPRAVLAYVERLRSVAPPPSDAGVEAAEALTVYCDVCEADRREPCHTVTTGDPAPYPHPERAVAAKLAARGGE